MYALVDCNNFYASCERVFRPQLNGKPIAVLSNNDGCVIARSNEVKQFAPMVLWLPDYKKIRFLIFIDFSPTRLDNVQGVLF